MSTGRSCTLPPGDGLKQVFVPHQDAVGNESEAVFATVQLDKAAPTLAADSLPTYRATRMVAMGWTAADTDSRGRSTAVDSPPHPSTLQLRLTASLPSARGLAQPARVPARLQQQPAVDGLHGRIRLEGLS